MEKLEKRLHMTIDAYETHMRRRGLTNGTIERRLIALRAFDKWLGEDTPILATSPEQLNAFLDELMASGIVDRTRACWISHLRCYFGWAELYELIDRNPTRRLESPRLDRLLPRPIGEGDLSTALEVAGPIMRAQLTLGAYAGLRCMEIAGLTSDAVLAHDGVLRIVGKGRKERLVPIHPAVTDALDVIGLPARGTVFSNGVRRLLPREVSTRINQFLHGLGIAATAHMLRHRFGTVTYRICKDIRVVQELLGHSSPATSAGYAAYSKDDARAAVLGIGMPPQQTRLLF